MAETKFNPNARAQERERSPIQIGERKYKPRRRINAVNRGQRALERDATNVLREMNRLGMEQQDLLRKTEESAEDTARVSEIDDRLDELDNQIDRILYVRIAALLRPAEKDADEEDVDPDYLEGELDIQDARDLLKHLLPQSPELDPTLLAMATSGQEPE